MKENYLRYLTTFFDDYGVIKNILKTKKDHSFLKKELKPMSFLPKENRIFIINVENIHDEDIQYLVERLKRSLMVPSRFLDEPSLDNLTDYFDEYH